MVTMLKPRIKLAPDRIATSTKRPNATKRIRGSALQKIIDRIMTRDAGMCRCDECQATGRILPAHQVDHRIPLWEGGAEDDANRVAINADCHARKTAAEATRRSRGG